MTRIIMVGCGGKMGQVISGIVEADEDAQIVAGVDIAKAECGYPVYPRSKRRSRCDYRFLTSVTLRRNPFLCSGEAGSGGTLYDRLQQ